MSLLGDLSSAPGRSTKPCEFGSWRATLGPEEAAAVTAALADLANWTHRRLAEVVTANGHPVSGSTIANHRRNECQSCRS